MTDHIVFSELASASSKKGRPITAGSIVICAGGCRGEVLNQYGWRLVRVVFGKLWRAGYSKDQIRVFARIRPEAPAGAIKTRKDFERVMRTVRIDVARMESKRPRGDGL